MSVSQLTKQIGQFCCVILGVIAGACDQPKDAPTTLTEQPQVSITLSPPSQTIYHGECVPVQVRIDNKRSVPVRVMHFRPAFSRYELDFEVRGEKRGRLGRLFYTAPPGLAGPEDYAMLGPGECLTHDFDGFAGIYFSLNTPDTYTVTAVYKVEGKTIRSDPATVVVRELPELEGVQVVTVSIDTQGETYKKRLELGYLPVGSNNGGDLRTLMGVSKQTQTEIDKATFHITSTDRIGRFSPKAKIEAGPIAFRGLMAPADVHVIVTEPDGSQHYFVYSLGIPSGITKSESFKERKVRMLPPDDSGNVQVIVER
jgi:hypothetical protein